MAYLLEIARCIYCVGWTQRARLGGIGACLPGVQTWPSQQHHSRGRACVCGSVLHILLPSSLPPLPLSPLNHHIYGLGIWCLKDLVLFSLTSKPKTICCNRWQKAGILRARYFITGTGPSS